MIEIPDDDPRLETGVPGHERSVTYADDTEHCVCGKWLEDHYYEFDEHIRDVLEDPED